MKLIKWDTQLILLSSWYGITFLIFSMVSISILGEFLILVLFRKSYLVLEQLFCTLLSLFNNIFVYELALGVYPKKKIKVNKLLKNLKQMNPRKIENIIKAKGQSKLILCLIRWGREIESHQIKYQPSNQVSKSIKKKKNLQSLLWTRVNYLISSTEAQRCRHLSWRWDVT